MSGCAIATDQRRHATWVIRIHVGPCGALCSREGFSECLTTISSNELFVKRTKQAPDRKGGRHRFLSCLASPQWKASELSLPILSWLDFQIQRHALLSCLVYSCLSTCPPTHKQIYLIYSGVWTAIPQARYHPGSILVLNRELHTDRHALGQMLTYALDRCEFYFCFDRRTLQKAAIVPVRTNLYG